MKTIELYADRMGILDIATGFDEKFRNNFNVEKIFILEYSIVYF